MNKAVAASLAPPTPSNQMTIAAPIASKIASTASTSAPASVDSAGTISSAPERTMMTAIKVAASENSATRRAHSASRDGGSSMVRRRAMVLRFHLLPAGVPPLGFLPYAGPAALAEGVALAAAVIAPAGAVAPAGDGAQICLSAAQSAAPSSGVEAPAGASALI